MLARALSGTVFGLDGVRVEVEADIADGLPGFHIVGLGDRALQEARERVKIAINNSGFEFPGRKVTINLAPAQLPKEGSGFDLAMAAAIVNAAQDRGLPTDAAWLGELALDGAVRPIRGTLPIIAHLDRLGIRRFYVPAGNVAEAKIATTAPVIGVTHFRQLKVHWEEGATLDESPTVGPMQAVPPTHHVDLAEIFGQPHAKRALEVAAAGAHHLLLVGPPGAGKTLLARALPGILPPLSQREAVEVTSIASCVGMLPAGAGLLEVAPFRAPHHTVSAAALVGGGLASPRPGEITRAHRGVLFMDEITEFRRDALESLRQPLEEGRLAVARTRGHAGLPGRFILVAAANPCPCGFAGDPRRICQCTPVDRQRYRARLSGPIRDRIDLQVLVPRQPAGELLRSTPVAESSAVVRERVLRARERQRERRPEGPLNGALTGPQLRREPLARAGQTLLEAAAERLQLSGRAIHRVLRVARTIADLGECSGIEEAHIAEPCSTAKVDRSPHPDPPPHAGERIISNSVVALGDPDYPALLKQIHDPPPRLYVNGRLPAEPMIAIVGSRRATPYGQRAARRLAQDLSEVGVVVVSGLARGIDAAAHRGALEGGSPTVAVMATGLDRIYPPEHAELAQAIAQSGAVITEAEPGTTPLPGRFPVRNRIISGLSLGVIVVEAAQRSGALITARMAAEQGRDVFCVPGSIENPLAIGVHQLIKDGAKLVQTVEDVLDEFAELSRARARASARVHARTRTRTRADSGPQDPELLAVWELLDWVEPRHHDDLAAMMNLDIKEVNRRLTMLELSGYIIGDCGAVTRSSRD